MWFRLAGVFAIVTAIIVLAVTFGPAIVNNKSKIKSNDGDIAALRATVANQGRLLTQSQAVIASLCAQLRSAGVTPTIVRGTPDEIVVVAPPDAEVPTPTTEPGGATTTTTGRSATTTTASRTTTTTVPRTTTTTRRVTPITLPTLPLFRAIDPVPMAAIEC